LRHERATEELRELAALYALGSLTQQEARSFEIHIAEGCSVCSSELDKFRHATAGIGFAAAEIPAPEYIRDLLSARIDREPQPPSESRIQIEEKSQQEFHRPSAASLVLLSQPGKERPSIVPWVLVVALAMLGIVMACLWKSTLDQTNQLQTAVSAARRDVESVRGELGAQKEDAGKLGKILDTVSKPGVRVARLVVQATPPSSSATVIWDTEKSQCLVLGSFPPAVQGKRYQLWLFTPVAKVPAGVLKTDPNGRIFETMRVPQESVNASAAVVTLEPDSGSEIPTSPYYAAGRIE
jgi:anti-sigma-K factor RskA